MPAFTTLFGEVCAQYNITVPTIGSNSSANGTNVTYPSPTASITPYTGAASHAIDGKCTTPLVAGLLLAAGLFFGTLLL